MAKGDHVRVWRRGYWHHGIDCGDGTVIHYDGNPFRRIPAFVRRTRYEEFAKRGVVLRVRRGDCDDPEVILARAESRLNEGRYNALTNNCEHFATWCRTGSKESRQVRWFLGAATSVAVVAIGVAATGLALAKLGRSRSGA